MRLLGSMFAAAGVDAVLAGNEHTPLSEVALTVDPGTWVVCELSSFQLEDVETFACDIAVLLNLEPDHLDRHGTFEAYREAKLRIFERAQVKIVPPAWVSTGSSSAAGDPLPAEPKMPGAHNRENAAAATAAARAAGIPDEAIAEALRTFAGVPHRLELVRELRGVKYVNDSKATNTAAARRGVAAYDEPLHLILGGSLKGEDFGAFRAGAPCERPLDPSRSARRATSSRPRSTPPAVRTRATAISPPRSRTRPQTRRRVTSCSSRRRRRASTSSATSKSVATRSGASSRSSSVERRGRSNGSCSCSSRWRSPPSG